jgi:hypothetical protein
VWRVLKRFVWEFWLSFVLAAAWAMVTAWPFQGDWLRGSIANFGVAFFLVSWVMGQFVRISRQQATEDTLGTLVGDLKGVASTVNAVKNRVDTLAAGNPALQPIAKEISSANTQLAQANSTASMALRQMRDLPTWAIYSFTSPPPLPLIHEEQAKKDDGQKG